LYRRTKAAGTLVFKFDANGPRFAQESDGGLRVDFDDPVMGMPCSLAPDICIVDEQMAPSERLAGLAVVLDLPLGPDGFLQTDNVHRQTVFTVRKGIFAVGPSRCVQSPEDHRVDAHNAALAVVRLLHQDAGEADTVEKAAISSGPCVRCLTCYRLCPYHAITVGTPPAVDPLACAGCGICAAECPCHAIQVPGLRWEDVETEVDAAPAAGATPRLVAFCCSRSAAQAAHLAACSGYPLPQGLTLVEVPCAGGVSLEHLLGSLRKGADGVLLLTCHVDNCHSECGNRLAHNRQDHLIEILGAVGFNRQRLLRATLAANQGREFSDIVTNFETVVAALASPQITA
jgi:coenzyme F420-reducing hydrogenase delta subunit/Pyruvate/2-oxoacid:ferredoxin oxidoreductase delta subunit